MSGLFMEATREALLVHFPDLTSQLLSITLQIKNSTLGLASAMAYSSLLFSFPHSLQHDSQALGLALAL